MIATALQIHTATGEAVTDISTMIIAKSIFDNFNEMTQDEMANALFAYSAHLSSLTATLVTGILLTEAQLDEMVSEIKEFNELGKEFN